MTLVWMVAVKLSGDGSLFSILMDNGVLFFKIVYNPFSYKMRGDVIRNDWKFWGVPDSVDDAMSNGGGDGGSENDMKTKDISVLVSEFVF